MFEGELVNGEKNGIGKEYDDGRLIYEGEILFGKRHGEGQKYYNNEEIYYFITG